MKIALILFIVGCIFVIIGYVNQISDSNQKINTSNYIETDLYKRFINDNIIL